MLPTRQGSFRLFQFSGIKVYLHWSWFVVAVIDMNTRSGEYTSYIWNVLEYVSLFAVVLMHEFGHALACRQVGGKADQIILWPLGGVAYVDPPPRPGATLWSIAAGPLVNVGLVPILSAFYFVAVQSGLDETIPNLYVFIRTLWQLNLFLLIFNMLPIYPLDGGQILRSLLWFPFGRARSLMITSFIGLIGVVLLIGLAVLTRGIWIWVIAIFILLNCWRGLMHARLLSKLERLPRRPNFACPVCHMGPVFGPLWRCGKCFKPFDMFETLAVCPHCQTEYPTTQCLDCGSTHPIREWITAPAPPTNPGP